MIRNCMLEIIIHMSALLCAWKPKNKIWHIVSECIYGAAILAFPIIIVSFFVLVIRENSNVDLFSVVCWVAYLLYGVFIYLVISNNKAEKAIEDYLLLGALYISEYINDKSRFDRRKRILIVEIIHFMFLFMALLFGIGSLLKTLKLLSWDNFMIAFIISLFLAYVLFVYGKREEDIQQRRKSTLGIFISLIWVIIVCIRINHYWSDVSQIWLEDILILIFSAVFTIPTMYEWVKNIPAKLVEPYSKEVHDQRDEIINKYVCKIEKYRKLKVKIIKESKGLKKSIVYKWKKKERKQKIMFFLYSIFMAGVMFAMIWIIMKSNIVGDAVFLKGKTWYGNLSYGSQQLIDKIFFATILLSIMIWMLFRTPRIYNSKEKTVEKIKCVIDLSIIEFLLGYALGGILVLKS